MITAAFVVGCGPLSPPEADGTGDGGTGDGTASADDGVDGGADATPTSGDPLYCDPAAGADPLEGADCNTLHFGVDEALPSITVRIANQTASAIVVPSHIQPPGVRYFDVAGTMGDRVAYTVLDPCPIEYDPPACASFSPEGVACTLIGYPPNPSVVIEPGGVYEQAWEPLIAAETALPAECGAPDDSTSCVSPVVAQAGNFEATVRAYPLEACGVACQCSANEFGWCETTGLVEMGQPTLATAAWNGQCATVDITFE